MRLMKVLRKIGMVLFYYIATLLYPLRGAIVSLCRAMSAAKIHKLVFVFGFPRSGTTLLADCLALDTGRSFCLREPANHAIRYKTRKMAEGFLKKISAMGQFKTLDAVASEIILGNTR